MPNAGRVDECRSGRSGTPLVLLAMDDDELCATFAYALIASGFDVAVTSIAASDGASASRPPDIIVATLPIPSGANGGAAGIWWSDTRLPGTPVVAIAADVSAATRDTARRLGCVAVCLSTCSGSTLATGLRAVLDLT